MLSKTKLMTFFSGQDTLKIAKSEVSKFETNQRQNEFKIRKFKMRDPIPPVWNSEFVLYFLL